jgi:hypothetical protein
MTFNGSPSVTASRLVGTQPARWLAERVDEPKASRSRRRNLILARQTD